MIEAIGLAKFYRDFAAIRIYLIRCYAKNVKTDLTADEKKQLRQIAARLKGALECPERPARRRRRLSAKK
jgi:hypothetical protein